MGKLLGWKGRPSDQGGHVRGPRSIRSWQKPAANLDLTSVERDTPKNIAEESPGNFAREEISAGILEATALNASSSERSGYEDESYQPTGNKYDDYLVDNNDAFSGKPENFIDQSHYNVEDLDIGDDVDVDVDVDVVDDDEEYGQVDVDVEDYIIGGDSDIGDNRDYSD